MKTLSNWQHLEPFGIDCLTAEACGVGYRLLCDLSAKGRKTLLRALGIPDISLCAPWNRGRDNDPSIGSIMLGPVMFEFLAAFALLEDGAKEVWTFKNGTVTGIYADDDPDQLTAMQEFTKNEVCRKLRASGSDRHRHQFSGRTE